MDIATSENILNISLSIGIWAVIIFLIYTGVAIYTVSSEIKKILALRTKVTVAGKFVENAVKYGVFTFASKLLSRFTKGGE